MNQKRPMLFYVLVFFVSAYSILNIANFYRSNDAFYDRYLDEHRSDLVSYLSLAAPAIENGDLKSLTSVLQEGARLKRIDFYLLSHKGEPIARHPGDASQLPVEQEAFADNQFIETDQVMVGTLAIGNNRLAIGTYNSRTRYLEFVFDQHKWSLLADITVVMLVIALIVAHYLKDIRRLTAQLRSPRKRDFAALATRSAEAETIQQGLRAFESNINSLSSRFKLLDSNTLPALKIELFSGKPPPYDFTCALVRIDINSYSTSLSELGAERYLPIVNDFFCRLTRVVDRYGGHVKEFLGDEAIFYFKEGLKGDSDEGTATDAVNLALAAVRDIETEAQTLDETLRSTLRRPFTIKSSIAFGSLHFGPLVHQMDLSGVLFIETVRILNEVTTKDLSQALLAPSAAARASACFSTRFVKSANLRGLKGPIELYEIERYESLSAVLEAAGSRHSDLTYFRSDEHLASVFRYLVDHRATLSSQTVLSILGVLKSQTCRSITTPLVDAYCTVLSAWRAMAAELIENERTNFLWELSSLTALGGLWVFEPEQKEQVKNSLLENFAIADDRLIANTIDALAALVPEESLPVVRSHMNSQNNRIKANALIKEGINHLDQKVLAQIESLLEHSEPRRASSAIYALTEIAGYYQRLNPVYFATNSSLQKLIARALTHCESENDMLRRQATRLRNCVSEALRPAA
jgi:class 3 adenylate cyclase